MDINEFFQQSAGKWFSQRTSHYLNPPQLEAGRTDLWIEILSPDEPDVIQLCQQHRTDPSLPLISARVKWDGTVGTEQRKQVGSTVLVAIADAQNPQTGKLLQRSANQEAVAGRYTFGSDGALTLTVESPTVQAQERIWFESANLRLRTSSVKRADGVSIASFCSEIRMGVTQPAAKAAATQSA